MLKIAKEKAKQKQLNINFFQGNCCSIDVKPYNFDAVMTIFNAIGHLTREYFVKTLQNIHNHLKLGGLYIFDIFNFDYLKANNNNNITKLTIDWIIKKIKGNSI